MLFGMGLHHTVCHVQCYCVKRRWDDACRYNLRAAEKSRTMNVVQQHAGMASRLGSPLPSPAASVTDDGCGSLTSTPGQALSILFVPSSSQSLQQHVGTSYKPGRQRACQKPHSVVLGNAGSDYAVKSPGKVIGRVLESSVEESTWDSLLFFTSHETNSTCLTNSMN